jgi:hypothetical protein
MDVPHRDRSTSTPSATGAFASIVPRGVDQRSDHFFELHAWRTYNATERMESRLKLNQILIRLCELDRS